MDEDGIAALFVASLGLLMTDSVTLTKVEIFAEPHKGTRGGPSDHRRGGRPEDGRLVELSHVIRAGMITYPGLPGPEIIPYLTREASREQYAPGTEFAIDRLTLVGNTGTYLDAPYHRYPDGADLSDVPLARTVDLPAGGGPGDRRAAARYRCRRPGRARCGAAWRCCCTPATTRGSAHRPTPRAGTS